MLCCQNGLPFWPLEGAWLRPDCSALPVSFIAVFCLQRLSWLAGVATVLNCTAVPQSAAVLITQMWAAVRQLLTNEEACFSVSMPYVRHVGPFPHNGSAGCVETTVHICIPQTMLLIKAPDSNLLTKGENYAGWIKRLGERWSGIGRI